MDENFDIPWGSLDEACELVGLLIWHKSSEIMSKFYMNKINMVIFLSIDLVTLFMPRVAFRCR